MYAMVVYELIEVYLLHINHKKFGQLKSANLAICKNQFSDFEIFFGIDHYK